MIEITYEMQRLVHDLDEIPGDSVGYVIKRIIELHEANKPKQEPLSKSQIRELIKTFTWRDSDGFPLFDGNSFAEAIEQYHGIGTSHEPT